MEGGHGGVVVIVGPHGGWAEPLDIPHVEKLMSRDREEGLEGVFVLGAALGQNEEGAVFMLYGMTHLERH
jgi:hypothetical protein